MWYQQMVTENIVSLCYRPNCNYLKLNLEILSVCIAHITLKTPLERCDLKSGIKLVNQSDQTN